MSDYTPTTERVRSDYGENSEGTSEKRLAAFDRWLAENDRQVAAKALTDAADDADKAAEDWRRSAAAPINPPGSALWDTRNAEYREAAARYLRKRAAAIVSEPSEKEADRG